MLILISDKFDDTLPKLLSVHGEVTTDKDKLADVDIVLVRSKTKVTKEYIDAAPNLKMIIRGGVGLDTIDVDYAREKAIVVHNTGEASTTAVAELAFAMMMALPNHICRADASMRKGEWIKKEISRTELHSKTLGILGMGRIGTALAIRARAFRMKILAWHPDVHFSDFAEIRSSLEDILSESDYISLHMPLLPSTTGLINKHNLKFCKKTAYVINTGRAQCVIEDDIASALRAGNLAGYATDVWNSDPPENSPLISAPNCLFTPHIGATTEENMVRIGIVIERTIKDFIRGYSQY